MLDEDEVDRENTEERIRLYGKGVELLRRAEVAQLKGYMKAFYSHGSLPDIVALRKAFEMREQAEESNGRASLVDALLMLLDVKPCVS